MKLKVRITTTLLSHTSPIIFLVRNMERDVRDDVVAIIVTHNPEIEIFEHVVRSVSKQVRHVVIVDNSSSNKDIIKDLNNCETIELRSNAGIARALRIGI